jgi:hypothetical protein
MGLDDKRFELENSINYSTIFSLFILSSLAGYIENSSSALRNWNENVAFCVAQVYPLEHVVFIKKL